MFSVVVRRAPAAMRAMLPLKISNPVSVLALASIRSPAIQAQGPRRSYNICYNCRREGHLRKDCTAPTICVACGVEGHQRRDCPNPDPARIEALNTAPKKCFRCGEAGHTLKECTERPTCYRCGQTGHAGNACPTAAAAAATRAAEAAAKRAAATPASA